MGSSLSDLEFMLQNICTESSLTGSSRTPGDHPGVRLGITSYTGGMGSVASTWLPARLLLRKTQQLHQQQQQQQPRLQQQQQQQHKLQQQRRLQLHPHLTQHQRSLQLHLTQQLSLSTTTKIYCLSVDI